MVPELERFLAGVNASNKTSQTACQIALFKQIQDIYSTIYYTDTGY